ncbi:MAG: phosphoenolpyruvate carboxylase [Thermoflexales bacterium]|nr:phosphoenolpyruvate carboxylase [Thermoflexales bacterium]
MTHNDHNLSFLADRVHWLGELLGEIIVAMEGAPALARVERIRQLAKASRGGDEGARGALLAEIAALTPTEAYALAMAFTTYFELVNLAEEDYRTRILQHRRGQANAPLRESIDAALAELRQKGATPEDVQRLLDNLSIELVFTAHPTESKRRTILSKLQRIKALLRRDARPPAEACATGDGRVAAAIRQEIAALWLSDRSRDQQPLATDEVRTGLWYFDATLWEVLPRLQEDLERALARHYPGLRAPRRWLSFGSWMGGDRDGNPNVTPAVTAETIHLHRRGALEKFRVDVRDLARRLSVSRLRVPVSGAVTALVDGSDARLSSRTRELAARYPREPYRVALSALAAQLEEAQQTTRTQPLYPFGHGRTLDLSPTLRLPLAVQAGITEADVAHVLDAITGSLRAGRGRLLIEGPLTELRERLNVFGLQMARLDLRQHADRHNSAVSEILGRLGEPMPEGLDEVGQLAALNLALVLPAASVLDRVGTLSDETRAIVEPLSLVREAERRYGEGVFGQYVISMTRDLSDVLEVLLLMRWARASLPISPLFETLDDLQRAPDILRAMFSHPAYRAHLAAEGGHQTIMLGYSDSNKDCGYVSSAWALFEAQEAIAATCAEAGIPFTIFHGRGGSIARGGGPAARAILAQPAGLRHGGIRVTEQGESLSTRYHDPEIAHRHLEQMAYGALLGGHQARHGTERPPAAWRDTMAALSDWSLAAYRALVEDPDFLVFWRQATPIDEIGALKLGSRPAFRKPSNRLADLRAIPWVFSWMQARFGVPGWYGLGTALSHALSRNPGAAAHLREMYEQWPFFATLIDNAQQTLTKADLLIAEAYLGLVQNESIRERIWQVLRTEHALTRATILQVTGQRELLDNEPMLQRSIQLRNPYVDPLSYIQADMIRRLREGQARGDLTDQGRAALSEVIELTINGVSSGLKNTG